MPRLNLKDEETGSEGGPPDGGTRPPTPSLREVGGGGGRVSPFVLILLVVAGLAAAVFALNYFKVIHLWGKKAPVVTESFSDAEPAPATDPGNLTLPGAGSETKAPAVAPAKHPAVSIEPTGTGKFTIQFSAWMSKSKADEQASLLTAGGYEAYVDEGTMDGQTWHRVRVGRYESRSQAQEVLARLQNMTEDQVYVAGARNK